MNIVSALFENILEFLPFTLVDETEEGVFLRGGKFKRVVSPGAHFTIPIWDNLITIEVKPQALTLPDIPVQMAEETWVIGSAISYSISDPRKYIIDVREPDELLQNLVLSMITKKFDGRKEAEIEITRKRIQDALKNAGDKYGVEILDFKFIKMAPCKTYMIMGHPPITMLSE